MIVPFSRRADAKSPKNGETWGFSRLFAHGSKRQNRRSGGARCAVQLGDANLRLAGHLTVARLTAEWPNDLMDLAQSRRTDRLAVGDQPAVGVDRHGAVDLGGAVGQQLLLFAIGAEDGFVVASKLRADRDLA